jgi:hypothetical protein
LNFYETVHSCGTQPADVHEGIPLLSKFRRGDNSTYTFTKRGVVYLVSATPPKPLIGLDIDEINVWCFVMLLIGPVLI